MDLAQVDTTTWELKDQLIEGYDTLIWTERYSKDADFEIKTRNIQTMLDALPLGSCVSLLDSKEVMMVENHAIDVDNQNIETLTISGKSLTSFSQYRILGKQRGKKYQGFKHSALASAGRLLYDAFVSTQGYDLSYATPISVGYRDANDAFPNTNVTFSSSDGPVGSNRGPSVRRFFTAGPIQPYLDEFMAYKPYGLRMVRPPYSSWRIEVLANNTYNVIEDTSLSSLCFDLFDGQDRSDTVIFDTEIDDLISPNYVMSIENSRNVANINLVSYAIRAFNPAIPNASSRSGINRRWLYVDGGEAEDGYTQAEWDEYNLEATQDMLADTHPEVNLIDGEISPQARWKFGIDYFLGDIVGIRSKYSPFATGRVTEYIRTEDASGEQGYPSIFYL